MPINKLIRDEDTLKITCATRKASLFKRVH
jgi:hypothetical protein